MFVCCHYCYFVLGFNVSSSPLMFFFRWGFRGNFDAKMMCQCLVQMRESIVEAVGGLCLCLGV